MRDEGYDICLTRGIYAILGTFEQDITRMSFHIVEFKSFKMNSTTIKHIYN